MLGAHGRKPAGARVPRRSWWLTPLGWKLCRDRGIVSPAAAKKEQAVTTVGSMEWRKQLHEDRMRQTEAWVY